MRVKLKGKPKGKDNEERSTYVGTSLKSVLPTIIQLGKTEWNRHLAFTVPLLANVHDKGEFRAYEVNCQADQVRQDHLKIINVLRQAASNNTCIRHNAWRHGPHQRALAHLVRPPALHLQTHRQRVRLEKNRERKLTCNTWHRKHLTTLITTVIAGHIRANQPLRDSAGTPTQPPPPLLHYLPPGVIAVDDAFSNVFLSGAIALDAAVVIRLSSYQALDVECRWCAKPGFTALSIPTADTAHKRKDEH